MTSAGELLAYPAAVTSRFNHPRHAGSLRGRPDVLTAQTGSRRQGASVRLWFEVEQGRVKLARFEAYGCPYFIAAAESLACWSEGRTLEDLSQWSWQSVQSELGVPAIRRDRLLLLHKALSMVVIARRTTQAGAG